MVEDLQQVTRRIDGDRAAVRQGHVRRLAALDPLVAVPPLQVGPDDVVLVARAGDAAALGLVRVERHDPAAEEALWGACHRIGLTPYAVGDDAEVAWDRLLRRWCGSLAELVAPGDLDTAATVTVASRDTLFARSLAHHGFAPLLTAAVRHAPEPPAAEQDADVAPTVDPRVRPMTDADLDEVTELATALHRYEASFGMVSVRDGSRALLRRSIESHRSRSPGSGWVVDGSDGRVAGFVLVDPPDAAGAVAPLVSVQPIGYLGYLYVRPGARRAGIGAALVATAHRHLDDAGASATLLHHALPSPLSGPFWARHGYRPLWTSWQRRPAAA